MSNLARVAVLLGFVGGVVCIAQPSLAGRAVFWGALNVQAPPSQLAKDARIFVSVTNTSTEEQTLGLATMCWFTDLVITDAKDDAPLPHAQRICAPCADGGRPNNGGCFAVVTLPTNAFFGDSYRRDQSDGERLAQWGYNLPPGTYRVYAVPTLDLWSNRSFGSWPVTSNVITITLH